MTDRKGQILSYLRVSCRGYNRAISTARLAEHCDCHERRIRESIHEMRRSGLPICSTERGYYWPESWEDAAPSIRHLTSLFQPLRESYEGFMRGLNDEFGQESLFGTEDVA